ncbi:MAG: MMPL family transporter [Bacteroidaceae bacterium]|nr:MMPL family transporter [Bacteroidaceae bacterium]
MRIETINEKFGVMIRGLLKRRWFALGAFVLILFVGMVGMKKMVKETSFDAYFIEGDPMLVKTDEFKAHFGNDYFVGVLTECDNIFTKKNLTLLRELSNELLDSVSYADKITSLTDIEFMVGDEWGMTIEQIVPDEIPDDGTPEMDEIRRKAYSKPNVARKLVSKDGRMSWVVLKLRAFPEDSVWHKETDVAPDMQTGEEVDRVLNNPKYASLNPKGTGMPVVSYEKMEFINEEMSRLMMIACIICLVVMIVMTKSLRGVISPFLSVIGGMFITYGIAGYTGMYVDSTTTLIPVILGFAVSIAYNIHIFSYFNGRMRIHGERRKAIEETITEIGWSVCFCGLTTIVSLLSFLVIPIRPMKCVGMICSMTVLFVMLTTLVITPVLLSFGRNRKPREGFTEDSDTTWTRTMVRMSDWTMNNSRIIVTVFTVICLVLCIGLFKIVPAFDIEQTMGIKVPYVEKVVGVGRSEMGSLYSYDLVIDLADEDAAKQPDNLRRLESLAKVVEGYPLTKRTTSILDILKDLNQTLNEGDEAFYRIPDSEEEVAQMMMLYENAGGSEAEYWVDYDYRRLRLMVEISDFNSAEVEKELNDIDVCAKEIFPGASVTAVGNLPQYNVMMQYLVRGQMLSFIISVLIIGVILMIAFQSVKVGLIGLIPNLMPAVFVGGIMGWAGVPLDMMTATIIPMMLGMAVDDTIHFINHSKLEYDRCGKYPLSINRTFRVVGVAIVTTSIITSAVFGAFTTSPCAMNFHFGLLAIVGIVSALAADLFVTPILVKRFKVFGNEINN